MPTYEFPAPAMIDADQLRAEVVAVVGQPLAVSRTSDTLSLTFDDDIDWTLLEDVIRSHRPAEFDQLDRLFDKARQVWSGQGSFTQAQAQKILAGLVLVVGRHLR